MVLALEAARMYYQLNLNQKTIANQMQVSPATVSRLLGVARTAGLVRIQLFPPPNIELAEKLQQHLLRFGIQKVHVAPPSREAVSQLAARDFESRIRENSRIVLDGGLTVAGFVRALEIAFCNRATIIPLCADPPSYDVSAYELMTLMASKCVQANCKKIPYKTGKFLDPIHKKVQQEALQADYVFLGVGPWEKSFTALENVRHLNIDPEALQRQYPGVIAVCGYCALDERGELVTIPELDTEMPRALGFEQLKTLALGKTELVVLAASATKLSAIEVVLRARMCNCLVLDEELAKALLHRLASTTV